MDHRRELIEFPEIYRKSCEEFRVNKLGCREQSALLGGKGWGSQRLGEHFASLAIVLHYVGFWTSFRVSS